MTTDDYIKRYPKRVRAFLENMRQTIRQAAPEATEVIKHQMPAFNLDGMLMRFGAFKRHIGFYPRGSAIEAFKIELSPYKFTNRSVQFPFNKPIPFDLVEKIVKFQVKESLAGKKG